MVLDLHHATGYRFQNLSANTLFEDIKQQERFIGNWMFLTKKYIEEHEHIAFEPLNEIVEPESKRWNNLLLRTLEQIRKIDK